MNAAERVRARVKEALEQYDDLPQAQRKTRGGLAAALGSTQGNISHVVPREKEGTQFFQLDQLDTIAAYFEVGPADLVKQADSTLTELRPDEARWLQHYRDLPRPMQRVALAFWDYMAAVAPAETDTRRLMGKYRALTHPDDRAAAEQQLDDMLKAQRRDEANAGYPPVSPQVRAETDARVRTLRRPKRRASG